MKILNLFKVGIQSLFSEGNGFLILAIIVFFYLIKYIIINIKDKFINRSILFIFNITSFIIAYLFITINYKYGCCDLPPARWIGAPLMYLFVPIISLIIDLNIKKDFINKITYIRYLIEIVIIYILWIPVWTFLHFVFGWVYI